MKDNLQQAVGLTSRDLNADVNFAQIWIDVVLCAVNVFQGFLQVRQPSPAQPARYRHFIYGYWGRAYALSAVVCSPSIAADSIFISIFQPFALICNRLWILNQVIATSRRLYFSWKILIETETDLLILNLAVKDFGDSEIATYLDLFPTLYLSLEHIAGGMGSSALLVCKSSQKNLS